VQHQVACLFILVCFGRRMSLEAACVCCLLSATLLTFQMASGFGSIHPTVCWLCTNGCDGLKIAVFFFSSKLNKCDYKLRLALISSDMHARFRISQLRSYYSRAFAPISFLSVLCLPQSALCSVQSVRCPMDTRVIFAHVLTLTSFFLRYTLLFMLPALWLLLST
jgi:hypothetical protein